MTILEVETLEIPREEVQAELATLKQGIKDGVISKTSKLVRDLLAIYGHLAYKGKLIDVYEAFQAAGLDQQGNPKLAIVRADAKFCHLYKRKHGGAIFSAERKEGWGDKYAVKMDGDVGLPTGTYGEGWNKIDPDDRFWRTVTPLIPPRIAVAISAKIIPYHYHLLWEPEGWANDPAPPIVPHDPILGRMLTRNLFGVYAHWDLTDLERKLLKGQLK